VLAHSSPWLPPRAAIPCSPQPRRCSEKVRHTVLYFPLKESIRRALNHRRSRGFLAGKPSSPPPNSPPPAVLRPRQPHRRT
jgi:hypothetical protein